MPYKYPLRGSCFCGKIRYEVTEEVLKEGVCYCKCYQRLTGGSCWPFIVSKKENIIITGELKEITRMAESGKAVHCGFCPDCGSTLFGRPERWPDILTISISTLEDAKNFQPSFQAWGEEAQSWMTLDPSIEVFDSSHM